MTHVRFITIIFSSFALSLQFGAKKKLYAEKKLKEEKWIFIERICTPADAQWHKLTFDRIDMQSEWITLWNVTTIISMKLIYRVTNFSWMTNYYLNLELSQSSLRTHMQIAKHPNRFWFSHFPRLIINELVSKFILCYFSWDAFCHPTPTSAFIIISFNHIDICWDVALKRFNRDRMCKLRHVFHIWI